MLSSCTLDISNLFQSFIWLPYFHWFFRKFLPYLFAFHWGQTTFINSHKWHQKLKLHMDISQLPYILFKWSAIITHSQSEWPHAINNCTCMLLPVGSWHALVRELTTKLLEGNCSISMRSMFDMTQDEWGSAKKQHIQHDMFLKPRHHLDREYWTCCGLNTAPVDDHGTRVEAGVT